MHNQILIERLVEAIRFDVDYHLNSGRTIPPSQGTFSREFSQRIEHAKEKGDIIFHKDLRRRVFGALLMKGTIENHAAFNSAVEEFKRRISRFTNKIAEAA